jgi:hypothetical protein
VTLAAVSFLGRYEGMRFYGRGLALGAIVRDGYAQRLHDFESRGWRSNPKVPTVWVNDQHPDHIAYRLGGEGAWRVLQRLRGRASPRALQAAADSFAGEPAALMSIAVFPRALRTPVRLTVDSPLILPTDLARCRPFGPKAYREIEGHEVELRLSRTTASHGNTTICAEAFVMRHETRLGEPRAKLFLADARRVSRVADNAAARFIAGLLDALFLWVLGLREQGIVPDDRRFQLPQVAVAHGVEAVGDVFFDVQLPGPWDGRRLAAYASGGFMPLEGDADLELLFASLADDPTLLARPGVHARDEILGRPNANDDAG